MLNLFAFEVIYYFKNKKELIEIYIFILTVILLLSFGLRSTLTVNPELSIATLWLAMAAMCSLSGAALFERDAQSGRMELYQMLPAGIERVVLGKWLAFYLLMLLPLLLVMPLLALTPVNIAWGQVALGLAFGTAGISALACLAAGLLAGSGRGSALLSLIVVPLAVPVIIFGTAYCRQGGLFDDNLLFLAAYTALTVPLMCLACASAIRASH